MGLHRHPVAGINHRDDSPLIQGLHQFTQIQRLELHPDPAQAVFRKDESVVGIDRLWTDVDSVRVTLLDVDRPIAKPFVSHDAAPDDGDHAVISGSEPLEESLLLMLASREAVDVLRRGAPDLGAPAVTVGLAWRNAEILQKVETVDIHRLERDPEQHVSENGQHGNSRYATQSWSSTCGAAASDWMRCRRMAAATSAATTLAPAGVRWKAS